MKHLKILATLSFFTAISSAYALENIIKPYQGIRSSGMGGVKLLTGLYDENFTGNPARALANPHNRLTVIDFLLESNSNSIGNAGDIIAGGDVVQKVAATAGENNHGRIQTTFPSFYKAPRQATETETAGKGAWAIGILTSSQFDLALENNFNINPGGLVDAMIVGTYAHKFLPEDKLGVGINVHGDYRAAVKPGFNLINIIKDERDVLAGGLAIDGDIGATYVLPFEWHEFTFEGGVTINNVLESNYSIAQKGIGAPQAQPRTFGFGISAKRESLWKFHDTLFALELQDAGNNSGGSFFRMIHMGAEGHIGLGVVRIGFNQGYIAAGLGFLTRVATLEIATYGEELRLNSGGEQDRRYALRFAFQI